MSPTDSFILAQGNALGIRLALNSALKARFKRLESFQSISVPHITFIPFDLVFFEKLAVFLLESQLSMMLFLGGRVAYNLVTVARAHGESAITSLPTEFLVL